MGLKEKIHFLMDYPDFPLKMLQLRRNVKKSRKAGKQLWVFQCDFKGHYPYLEPLYNFCKQRTDIEIYFAIGYSKQDNPTTFLLSQGIPKERIIEPIDCIRFTYWDVYVSPTSWGNILPSNPDAYKVQIFHTLADKNLLYGVELLKFNVIFANGPIHLQFLEKYVFSQYEGSREKCLVINSGFAKIDNLFNGTYSKTELKDRINIDKDDNRKIVLYAPNWEATSALYRYGEDIFKELAESDYLVLIKLHYMSLISKEDHDATLSSENHGEFTKEWIDWRSILHKFSQYENVRILNDQDITPWLFLSDLMITDYGGASLEFLCLDKPIIYMDCPDFFALRGQDIFEYEARSTGLILDNHQELISSMDRILKEKNDKHAPIRKEMIKKLIYNPGKAAQKGCETLIRLVNEKSKG